MIGHPWAILGPLITETRLPEVLKSRLRSLIREHSGSNKERWKGPSQSCTPQDRKPDTSDCPWAQRFHALEPSRGISALQSQRQLEGGNDSHSLAGGPRGSARYRFHLSLQFNIQRNTQCWLVEPFARSDLQTLRDEVPAAKMSV